MGGNVAGKVLVGAAALLLVLNMLYSRRSAMPRSAAQVSTTSSPIEEQPMGGAAQAIVERDRKIAELERQVVSLKQGSAAAATLVLPASPESGHVAVALPPPPPLAIEFVPESERVTVPPGETLPESLRMARKGSDLFISFSSSSMAPFLLNWIANLRRSGVTKLLVGALDPKMEEICRQNGIDVLPIEGSSIATRGAANLRFDYGAYKRMAALKVSFYRRILAMGFNIWACDADTGWMADPAPFIKEYPMEHVDLLTTTDCIDVEGDVRGGCWHVDHNTGLVYMRSRPILLEFLDAWKLKIQTTRDIMVRDQAALNLLLRENFRSKTWTAPPDPEGGTAVRPIYLAWNDKLKIARLPLRYFANGHTYFVQRLYQKADHPPPFVVHMTYQYGDDSKFPFGKRQRMREGRVWQVDPPSYFSAGKYLAIAPEGAALPIDYLPGNITTGQAADRFNLEEGQLRPVLRDALALAIALNRTLVLPRMLCYCDNIWKEMKHCRVGGAFVPAAGLIERPLVRAACSPPVPLLLT